MQKGWSASEAATGLYSFLFDLFDLKLSSLKLFHFTVALTLLVGLLLPFEARAQLTLLPQVEEGTDCMALLDVYEGTGEMPADSVGRANLLGCGIQTGRISLQMVPYFITAMSNFLLAMVGIVCVLFLVIGGYYQIYGGITDDKEKGKKTMTHAFMGMIIALLAWTFVNVIMTIVTS